MPINSYLSLTATRSTVDENPWSASSDLPAIFVASIPCAKASSHGAWILGTGVVGAARKGIIMKTQNAEIYVTFFISLFLG